jgi:hypothetical protein
LNCLLFDNLKIYDSNLSKPYFCVIFCNFYQHDKGEKHRGFGDFFPIQEKFFQERLEVISMEEFFEREGNDDGQFPIPAENRTKFMDTSIGCDKRAKSMLICKSTAFIFITISTLEKMLLTQNFVCPFFE